MANVRLMELCQSLYQVLTPNVWASPHEKVAPDKFDEATTVKLGVKATMEDFQKLCMDALNYERYDIDYIKQVQMRESNLSKPE